MKQIIIIALLTAGTCFGGADDKNVAVMQMEIKELKTSFSLGFGYFQATADEIVYGGSSESGELSHLVWKTQDALTVEGGFRHSLNACLDTYADFTTALVDQGQMVDDDWLGSGTQWTDRSIHNDTELDAYCRIDAGVEWTFLERESSAYSALFGFRYIDIAWTARGGSYVYSTDPDGGLFRNERGSFPSDEKGISYQQKIPGLYLGPQAEWTSGRVNLRAAAIGGVTIGASDSDQHWAQNTQFEEKFDSQVFFELSLALRYQLTKSLSYFIDGRYEQYELMKGSIQFTDLSTGESETYNGDAAGAQFGSWQIQMGLEVSF